METRPLAEIEKCIEELVRLRRRHDHKPGYGDGLADIEYILRSVINNAHGEDVPLAMLELAKDAIHVIYRNIGDHLKTAEGIGASLPALKNHRAAIVTGASGLHNVRRLGHFARGFKPRV